MSNCYSADEISEISASVLSSLVSTQRLIIDLVTKFLPDAGKSHVRTVIKLPIKIWRIKQVVIAQWLAR